MINFDATVTVIILEKSLNYKYLNMHFNSFQFYITRLNKNSNKINLHVIALGATKINKFLNRTGIRLKTKHSC